MSGADNYIWQNTESENANVNQLSSDLVSYKAEIAYVTSFGVVGDGIVDDTIKINAIVANGGTIVFPALNYKISDSIVTANPDTILLFKKGGKLIQTVSGKPCIKLLHDRCAVLNSSLEGTNASFTGEQGILLVGVSDCIVQNNTISKMGHHGIFLVPNDTKGCSDNLIVNNWITGMVSTVQDASGILLGYSGDGYFHTNNTVINNYIDGNGVIDNGIAIIAHGVHNTIRNNKVINCKRYGILAYNSNYTDFTLSHTTIDNNYIDTIGVLGGSINFGMGIYFQASDHSTIMNNKVYNALVGNNGGETLPQGAIAVNSSIGGTIENNYVYGSGRHGIMFQESHEIKIKGNEIYSPVKQGIKMVSCNDLSILGGNVIRTNNNEQGIYGIFMVTSTTNPTGYKSINTGKRIIITGNNINTGTYRGIELCGLSTSLLENIIISDNEVYSEYEHIVLEYAKDSIISRNICKTTSASLSIEVIQSTSSNIKILDNVCLTSGSFTVGIRYAGTLPDIRGNYINSAGTYTQYASENFRNEKIKLYNGVAPTTGAFHAGDLVYNTNPMEIGSVGSKYVLLGWLCVADGTPGTWQPLRCLTGN